MATYRKLVRDKVPDRIRRNGEEPVIRTLEVAEFKAALFDKLVEEAEEARNATTHRELLEELGDIDEVLDAVYKLNRVKRKRVRRIAREKRAKSGGFKKRIYLVGVKKKK